MDHTRVNLEYKASKPQWKNWLHGAQGYKNVVPGKTYAQALTKNLANHTSVTTSHKYPTSVELSLAKEQVSAKLIAHHENMVGSSGSMQSQKLKVSADKRQKHKSRPDRQVDTIPFLENRFTLLENKNPCDPEFMVNQANEQDTMESAKHLPLSSSFPSSQSRYMTKILFRQYQISSSCML